MPNWQDMLRSRKWQAGGAWYDLVAGCILAYQPKGAADLAASYVNLKNPGTYNAAPGTAPSWAAATGWTFDGSTQWLTTGCTFPGTANTWSLFVAFSGLTKASSTTVIAGSIGVPTAFNDRGFGVANCDATRLAMFDGGAIAYNSTATAGVAGVSAKRAYFDGVDLGAVGSLPCQSSAITIAGRAASSWLTAVTIKALWVANTTVSGTDAAIISAAMAAL